MYPWKCVFMRMYFMRMYSRECISWILWTIKQLCKISFMRLWINTYKPFYFWNSEHRKQEALVIISKYPDRIPVKWWLFLYMTLYWINVSPNLGYCRTFAKWSYKWYRQIQVFSAIRLYSFSVPVVDQEESESEPKQSNFLICQQNITTSLVWNKFRNNR